MAIATKSILYWTACLLYGALLTGVLLYVRFPAEKVRRYVERTIEGKVPETSCTIARISYEFPLNIVFHEVQLTGNGKDKQVLFSDPRLALEIQLQDPIRLFDIDSAAYGGRHKARILVKRKEDMVKLSSVTISGVDLNQLSFFHQQLDRKVSGVLGLSGEATFTTGKGLELVTAKGVASINGGAFSLKKPILQLSAIELQESSMNFHLNQKIIELTKGKVKNNKLNAGFAGKINLAESWPDSSVALRGGIIPMAPLYKKKKQLKNIVSRLQKKYRTKVLPYRVNGMVGRPTFSFGN